MRPAIILTVLILLTYPAQLLAADFFVSTDGSRSGDGSISAPWDLKTALEHPRAVKPGDSIYLRAGVYEIPGKLNFNCRLEGQPDAYITVAPYGHERAIIDGSIQVLSEWVSIRDLEFRNTTPVRVTTLPGSSPADITQPIGLDVFKSNVKIINNVIHDTSTGLGSWREAANNEFYGNISFYNGWVGPDRSHGHGVYMQNEHGAKLLADNIVFGNAEYGMQIYGSSETFLNGFVLDGNVVFSNGLFGRESSRNILLGGSTVASDPVLMNNVTYFPLTSHGGDNNIGYYPSGSGCTNLKLLDNYFVSGGSALTVHSCTYAGIAGNTWIGDVRGLTPAQFPGNAHLAANARPTLNRVTVRPNKYERGRSHIISHNWDRREFIEASLENTGLVAGEVIQIRDVQNLFGEPVWVGTYTGKPVRIPTTRTAVDPGVALPVTPPHTDREFNTFLVRLASPDIAPAAANVSYSNLVEFEDIPRSETTLLMKDEGASRGQAMVFPRDGTGWAYFDFEAPKSGYYRFWLRAKSLTGRSTTLAVRIGDRAVDYFDPLRVSGPDWGWIALSSADTTNGDQPILVYLAAGRRQIAFHGADPDFILDGILVTNELGRIPAGGDFVRPPE
jgi:hypothetical protein